MLLATQLLLKMRLWELLPFLVLFIFLWGIQEPKLAEGFFLRMCPKPKVKCTDVNTDECSQHAHCPSRQKCCQFVCDKICMDPRDDFCTLPKNIGPCMFRVPRWYYNKETGVCTQFIFGGCMGNRNNFKSESICKSICKK
ncbi:WAP four-disulfide core domain protein 6A-like [Alexandromys fortis]|uniref:WAP four-disulfide core domain protein 6A-like n=1 Tax=Alexandromys fortis TaxID=100897 RepID=UPI00215383AE|nr:WAP four-disulfide core domain protein 6A-like [Microtus fortis]